MSTKAQARQKAKRRPGRRAVKARPATSRARAPRPAAGRIVPSACGKQYFVALADPFGEAAVGACVPKWPTMPSQRYYSRLKVNVNVKGGEFGYAVLAPYCGATLNGGSYAPLRYSNATYTATGAKAIDANYGTALTAGVSQAELITPWGASYIASPALQVRLVAAGMRARYVGTEYNRGGLIYCYENADHGSLNGTTFDQLTSNPKVKSAAVTDGSYCTTTWQPILPEEVQYNMASSPSVYPQPAHTNGNMIVAFQAPAGADAVFELQVICHYEAIGRNTTSAVLAPADTMGFERVNIVFAQVLSSLFDRISEGVVSAGNLANRVLSAANSELGLQIMQAAAGGATRLALGV